MMVLTTLSSFFGGTLSYQSRLLKFIISDDHDQLSHT
jgi:hypothetical protein